MKKNENKNKIKISRDVKMLVKNIEKAEKKTEIWVKR